MCVCACVRVVYYFGIFCLCIVLCDFVVLRRRTILLGQWRQLQKARARTSHVGRRTVYVCACVRVCVCVCLCYAMLCYAMLCYTMLCYAMLCYAMLCYAMLYYAMLCYALLRML